MERFKGKTILSLAAICCLLVSCSKDTPTETTTSPARPELYSPAYAVVNVSISPSFTWSSVNGAEGYKIQISSNDQFSGDCINAQATSTSYSSTTPVAGFSTYFWRVCSYNSAGSSSWTQSSFFATGGIQQAVSPSAPVLASPLNGAVNVSVNPVLIWSPSDSLSVYALQITSDSTFSNINFQFTAISGIYKEISGYLTDNNKYYWRVKSSNVYGSSAWSSIRSFTTAAQVLPE